MSSWCGTFVRTKSKQSPLEQRVSLQAQLFSHQKIKCSIGITNLHCVGKTRLTWSTNCTWPLLYTAWVSACPLQRSITAKFFESRILASHRPIAPFCAIVVIRPIVPFAPLGDRHHRISPTHTTKFGAWLWYQLLDLGHHLKRLIF